MKMKNQFTLRMLSNVYHQSLPDFSVKDENGKQLHEDEFVTLSNLDDKILDRVVVKMTVQSCYGMPAIYVIVN